MGSVDPYALYRSGSCEPWTVALLQAFVRAKMPHVLLETGTFEGRTAMALLEAMVGYAHLHGSRLYTVEADSARYEDAKQRIERCLVPQGVGVQLGFGDAMATLELPHLQGAVDFVF